MSDFLPLELNVDGVEIYEVMGGWEIHLKRPDADDLIHWTDTPDGLFEQLVQSGEIEL